MYLLICRSEPYFRHLAHGCNTCDKSLECPPWYAARDVAWNTFLFFLFLFFFSIFLLLEREICLVWIFKWLIHGEIEEFGSAEQCWQIGTQKNFTAFASHSARVCLEEIQFEIKRISLLSI